MEIELYHGSENRIVKPKFGVGNIRNDYGLAFYTTMDKELAMEWAVDSNQSGYLNRYKLDLDGLSVLNLDSDEYTILHWLAILVDNRTFDINTDFGAEAKKYLLDNFLLDYTEYDVITGYRADDSYFSFAQDFLNNEISISTLAKAMKLGNLGTQIAIKSEKAFHSIRYEDSNLVNSAEWYPAKEHRDELARKKYHEIRNTPWKRGEIYMMKIVDEELRADDVRLR